MKPGQLGGPGPLGASAPGANNNNNNNNNNNKHHMYESDAW
jgi:hypothetical protein